MITKQKLIDSIKRMIKFHENAVAAPPVLDLSNLEEAFQTVRDLGMNHLAIAEYRASLVHIEAATEDDDALAAAIRYFQERQKVGYALLQNGQCLNPQMETYLRALQQVLDAVPWLVSTGVYPPPPAPSVPQDEPGA